MLDIQGIINQKVNEMNESKIFEKTIQETLEKIILKAVADSLNSYTLRNQIEDKLKKQVSVVIDDISFEGYNSFIVEKLKQIINGTCKKDIEEKIKKTFEDILVLKRESIKLSDIFKSYKEWVCGDTEESEKYDLEGQFYVKFEKSDYGWYNVELNKEKPECYEDRHVIKFTIHDNRDGSGWIGNLYISGYNIKKTVNFGYLNEFESLILNLKYNQTPIIIDVEDEDDIDNSFDIDY